MKWVIITLLVLISLVSCVSPIYFNHQKVEASWKNPKYNQFFPSKIFVIGLCNNATMRRSFEDCFTKQFKDRGIASKSCNEKYKTLFSNEQLSENAINQFNLDLINEGYDAIFVMAINGTSKQLDYKKKYYAIYHNWYRFGTYTKYMQDYSLFPTYYTDYTIYNLECALYEVSYTKNKSLIWAGVIKNVNPTKITAQFDNISTLIIKELETYKLIQKSV